MSKEVFIMPLHISSLVKNPKGFFNQHAPISHGWVCHHTVNMDSGEVHLVTEETFLILKRLLWVNGDQNVHSAKDEEVKKYKLTTLMKIDLLT